MWIYVKIWMQTSFIYKEEALPNRALELCLEVEPHSMASATALWRSRNVFSSSWDLSCFAPPTFLSDLGEDEEEKRGVVQVSVSVSGPVPRKLRAVTTSLMSGRTEGSSLRHMAATATAWCSPLIGKSPWRSGSANCGYFLGSLNVGFA